jgi:hypothetical protein
MENKPPNPNAFPLDAGSSLQRGMSLRDYFANSAMQGLMSMENKGTYGTLEECYQKIAETSYAIADAMLKERQS